MGRDSYKNIFGIFFIIVEKLEKQEKYQKEIG